MVAAGLSDKGTKEDTMGLTRDDKGEIVELCNRYALALDDAEP